MMWSEQGIELTRAAGVDRQALVDLYGAVGWTVYTRDPEALARAIAGAL